MSNYYAHENIVVMIKYTAIIVSLPSNLGCATLWDL